MEVGHPELTYTALGLGSEPRCNKTPMLSERVGGWWWNGPGGRGREGGVCFHPGYIQLFYNSQCADYADNSMSAVASKINAENFNPACSSK